MADIAQFILKANDQASPVFARTAVNVKQLETTVRAYGTGTQEARAATSKMLDELRASRGATEPATQGIDNLGSAAKRAAKGGMQELASQVPVVGGVLGDLASKLSGFPLLLGGIVGAGVGVISFLKNMQAAATENLAAISALGNEIQTRFTQAILSSQKAIADANGDRVKSIELSYRAEVQAAEAAAEQKIAKAKAEFDAIDQAFFTTYDQRMAATEKFNAEVAAANGIAAAAEIEANGKKNAAIIEQDRARKELSKALALEAVTAESQAAEAALRARGELSAALEVSVARDKAALDKGLADTLANIQSKQMSEEQSLEAIGNAHRKHQADLLALETKTASDRKSLIENFTAKSLEVFQELGTGFTKVIEKLQLAQFVAKTNEAMKALKEAFRLGVISGEELREGLKKLTSAMRDAIDKGIAPMTEKTKEANAASEDWFTTLQKGELQMTSIGPKFDAMGRSVTELMRDFNSTKQEFLIFEASIGKVATGLSASTGSFAAAAAAATTTANTVTVAADAVSGAADRLAAATTKLGTVANPITGKSSAPGGGGVLGELRPGETLQQFFQRIGLGSLGTSVGFASGGQIPGGAGQAVPIVGHGGELVGQPQTLVKAFAQALKQMGGFRGGESPARVVQIGPVSVNGAVIQSERDFDTLVQEVGHRLIGMGLLRN